MEPTSLKNNYFDYELAMKYLANNPSILLKITETFLENYDGFLELIEVDTYDKIHSLKGITLNLGAEALYYECQEVLQAIKTGEPYDMSSFKYCFARTYDALMSFKDEQ